MKVIICDKCGKASKNPKQDGFCKVLIYVGMGFHLKSKGSKYTHHHFCKKCKEKLLLAEKNGN